VAAYVTVSQAGWLGTVLTPPLGHPVSMLPPTQPVAILLACSPSARLRPLRSAPPSSSVVSCPLWSSYGGSQAGSRCGGDANGRLDLTCSCSRAALFGLFGVHRVRLLKRHYSRRVDLFKEHAGAAFL
jgi:hypothetical protein